MRAKIIAGNFFAVLLVGLVSFLVVKGSIDKAVSTQLEGEIGGEVRLFERSWRLSAVELLERVREQSVTPAVRGVFTALDENGRRQRAHEACNGIGATLQSLGVVPDVVLVTDETGKVVARDKDPNRFYQTQLSQTIAALRSTLADGAPRIDIWLKSDENKLLRVAVTTITNEAGTAKLGALVVGYDLATGLSEEAKLLGHDVAVLGQGRVYAASLPDASVGDALRKYLFEGEGKAAAAATLGQGQRSTTWRAELGADSYVGALGAIPAQSPVQVGFAVLGNESKARSISSSATIILIMMAFGLLVVVGYGMLIGSGLLRPIEEMEEGILAVINGRTDLRLDIKSAEFGGLAYRVNQLMNTLLQVDEGDGQADEDGGGGPAWRDGELAQTAGGAESPAASVSGGAGSATDPIDDAAVAARLAAEPQEAYYERIYQEYAAAKQAIGESIAGMPKERFIERLKGNETASAQKFGVPAVRFVVQSGGGAVNLRPVLLR